MDVRYFDMMCKREVRAFTPPDRFHELNGLLSDGWLRHHLRTQYLPLLSRDIAVHGSAGMSIWQHQRKINVSMRWRILRKRLPIVLLGVVDYLRLIDFRLTDFLEIYGAPRTAHDRRVRGEPGWRLG